MSVFFWTVVAAAVFVCIMIGLLIWSFFDPKFFEDDCANVKRGYSDMVNEDLNNWEAPKKK